MRNQSHTAPLAALAFICGLSAAAQTYVTPMMGGGQVWADMVHIDVYYDADANQLHAQVDDSYGTPQLRPLEAGYAFDPQQPYAVLNGKAYNAQYGWNVGGLFTIPAGAAIWIELINTSPGLEVYSGSGTFASYLPILGTAGAPRLWKWSGVMVHNTYAVLSPLLEHYFAEYHIYFGDASTGSRTGFENLGDTTVKLQWDAVPVEDGATFKFGAVDQTNNAPVCFLNSQLFTTNSLAVINLRHTNDGPRAGQFEGAIPILVLPATSDNGGPMTNHAALGACLALYPESLSGPSQGLFSVWENGQAQPCLSLRVGQQPGTKRLVLSQNSGQPGSDPYGLIQGRRVAVTQPGHYCLGFRVIDTSTNGLGAGPIHLPSLVYYVYLQAGLTISSITRQGSSATVQFGGESGKVFYLEYSPVPSVSGLWQTAAGPLSGSNCLQTLTDPAASPSGAFFRLLAQ
jgi:hypothetical protein